MDEEKERLLQLIAEKVSRDEDETDSGVDYATEYKRQTGKDIETGQYVTQ